MSQLQEPKKTSEKNNEKKKKKKSSIYRQTITNQYFLRSISDCARRWPHPKRRPKQQEDIEGDSDIYIYIEREREQRYLLEGLDEERER